MPRGGTREAKEQAIKAIRDRQELIEETGEFNPFLIFPEGTTSNGSRIMPFKQGAFLTEKRIKPILMNYSQGTVSPALDIMEFLPLAIMMLSWGCYCCEVTVFPDFEPNEYLFTTHADKGQERWAIYAWALREILAKHGGFG